MRYTVRGHLQKMSILLFHCQVISRPTSHVYFHFVLVDPILLQCAADAIALARISREKFRKWLITECPTLNSSIDRPRSMPAEFVYVGSRSIQASHKNGKGTFLAASCIAANIAVEPPLQAASLSRILLVRARVLRGLITCSVAVMQTSRPCQTLVIE